MKNTKLLIAIIASAVAVVTGITLAIVFLTPGECKHESAEWRTATEATCTAEGVRNSVCKDCGTILKTENIDKIAHKEVVDAAKAPTCAATGLTEGKHCSMCGTVTVAQKPVDKTAHTYDGVSDADCNVCGETRVVACSHAETEAIPAKAATCTETGLTEGAKCKKCGEIIVAQEVLPIVAHTYDNKFDADCNVCGHKRDAECGHFETEIIPGKAASCTASGLTEGKKCKKCGEITVEQATIPEAGHTEEKLPAVAATCTKTGLTEGKKCSVCGAILLAQQETDTIPHIESDWIIDKEAANTEEGLRHTECIVCGKKLNEEEIPAKGSVGLAYTVNSDNKSCTITGIGDCTDSKIIIPASINGYTVSAVGEKAFYSCGSLSSIVIGDSVTSIGFGAFYDCISLTSVVIPDSVTSIGDVAFCECSSLTSIQVDSGNTSYKDIDGNLYTSDGKTLVQYAIGKADTSFAIPDSVTSIGVAAFAWCDNLTSIVIPDSVTSIGYAAFARCNSLTSVEIGDSVTSIGDDAFRDCTSLTSIVIPDSVTSIDDSAFYRCYSLTVVAIGNSVTSIGSSAFYGCSSLTSVVIPDSVTSIGEEAFLACNKLVEVINKSSLNITSRSYGLNAKEVHSGESKIVNHSDYIFYTYDGVNYLLGYVGNDTELVLPESYNGENYKIYLNAFRYNDNIASIEIPDSVTSIGNSAFYDCTSLASIVVPDSVTSIGWSAFKNCTSLTSIVIPDSVTSIGNSAFYNCTSLASIVIPDSVTSIGESAFHYCTSLTSIVIPDSVTSIGDLAFYYCTSLTGIVIPDSVTSIGSSAFAWCDSLTIYCEAAWKPSGWDSDWNYRGGSVVWSYKG